MNWRPFALTVLAVLTGAASAPPAPDAASVPMAISAVAVLDAADPVSFQLASAFLDWGHRSRLVADATVPVTLEVELAGQSPSDVQHALYSGEYLRSPLDHLLIDR